MSGKQPGLRLWAVAFWLCLWQTVSMLMDQELLLVSPVQVLIRLGELALTEGFWISVWNSLIRILCGFLLGAFSGILLACLSVRYSVIDELLAPVMAVMKAVPVASFIILALILFSSKNLAVFIAFLMVLPVFYYNISEGIHSSDRELLEMAAVFKIPAVRKLRYLYIPQFFPYFRSACAAGLGMSWKSGVAAEVIGIPARSIGENLYNAKVYFDTPDLLAWTLTIVLLSLLFDRIFLLVLRQIQKWTERV